MATIRVTRTRIVGIASALPEAVRTVADEAPSLGAEEMAKTARSIGVQQRHVAPPALCTSDLCFAAAKKLLQDLNWDPQTVTGLIFVSQSPDYELPATACTLQHRLGLSDQCAAFDVNLGCSGFVYGLWLGSQIVTGGGIQRLLLLAGDISTRRLAPQDKSVIPLFGDAGTATALAFDPDAAPIDFELGTDGSGAAAIIIPASGFRQPRTAATKERHPGPDGIARSAENIYINGAEVFNFTIKRIPPLVDRVIAAAGRTKEDYDYFVFHQANAFMLQHLGKRLKLPPEKFPITMETVGNTSSASIPLALTMALSAELGKTPKQMLLCGFGVGLSWAAASLVLGPLVIAPPILVPDPAQESALTAPGATPGAAPGDAA